MLRGKILILPEMETLNFTRRVVVGVELHEIERKTRLRGRSHYGGGRKGSTLNSLTNSAKPGFWVRRLLDLLNAGSGHTTSG